MGSPAGSSGSGTGSSANVFTPGYQPQIDQNLLIPAFNQVWQPVGTDITQTPAGQVYPQAQDIAQMSASNPYYPMALGGALDISALVNPQDVFTQSMSAANSLIPTAMQTAAYAPNALQINPEYQASIDAIAQNPWYTMGNRSAQEAAALGTGAAPALTAGGIGVLNTAFDPQQQLYNQTANQVMQQQQAANAMAGLGSTPYGASTAGNTMGNFNIDWQNQQLARQAQGLQAAIPALTAAPQLAYTSGQLPSQTLYTEQQQLQNALNQQTAASTQGTTNYTNLLNSALSMLGGQQSLYGSSMANLLGATGAPANLNTTQSVNAMNALNSLVNLGNNQYLLPQQALNNALSYMGLGQQASQISGNLGQMGQNQLSQSMSGIGQIAGMAIPMLGS